MIVPATVTLRIPRIIVYPVVDVDAVHRVVFAAVLKVVCVFDAVAKAASVAIEVHACVYVAVPSNAKPKEPEVALIEVRLNIHSKKYVPVGNVIAPPAGPPPPSKIGCAAVWNVSVLAEVRIIKCSAGETPRLFAAAVL